MRVASSTVEQTSMAKISGNPERYKDIRIATMVNVGAFYCQDRGWL
jgi:hypothetical protein